MRRLVMLTIIFGCGVSAAQVSRAADPALTVRQSGEVLAEALTMPGSEIPSGLLAEAQGVAIIPRVIKIGFVAGGRRGHGVVFVRDAQGEWSLPQFITLTGGSVGWQAGVQATDVVLVFTTRKGVEGLMKGKFTIGADASVAAGPVGRAAAAATDAALRAEIFSYSRSRGLFLGVSIDGSALEVDRTSYSAFYGLPVAGSPQRVPESAAQLRDYLVQLTTPTAQAQEQSPELAGTRVDVLRAAVSQNAAQLHGIVTPDWRQYLALPKEFAQPTGHPSLDSLNAVEQRYTNVDRSPAYRQLAERQEFQSTYKLLREYRAALSAEQSTLRLPPPPAK